MDLGYIIIKMAINTMDNGVMMSRKVMDNLKTIKAVRSIVDNSRITIKMAKEELYIMITLNLMVISLMEWDKAKVYFTIRTIGFTWSHIGRMIQCKPMQKCSLIMGIIIMAKSLIT